jgi:hypothetical protein
MIDWLGDLSKNGKYVSNERLHGSGKQVSGTTKTVTDIPFSGRSLTCCHQSLI